MKWSVLEDRHEVLTYAVVGDEGDDAIEIINQFAREQEVTAAQVTAVGAFSKATVGWFDRAAKDYRRIEIGQQCEVLSLLGDIAASKNGPVAHLHVVLGLSDGQVRGGHLLAGSVWPTLEVLVRETRSRLRKTERPDIGLALIDLSASDTVG
ncbi:PPC domain-containing DNA-binding protein [Kribbella sp. NPDC059898]|uniref:PPC domain-containing DNA-binding protein n=1 Tax=Kribbella sp. NPDC059898 TaxID=3346995 RepID=UPI0036662148